MGFKRTDSCSLIEQSLDLHSIKMSEFDEAMRPYSSKDFSYSTLFHCFKGRRFGV